jgi:hypothetical protein
MKALFEILPSGIEPDKCILVCEINNENFSYLIKNEAQNMYVALAVFEFEKSSDENEYGNILQGLIESQPLLQGIFKKVCVIYSYNESVLIPFTLYSSLENESVLNLVHGNLQNDSVVLTDLVTEDGVYNAYRVPLKIQNVINSKFPGAENIHQYSALLKQTATAGDKLFIIFYPNRILVKLNKNGHVALINSFVYNTPEDVSYILLNICKQFDVKNIPVEVSGLIERDSILFKEIYKYFEVIDFASLHGGANYSEQITRQPAHYFSHIFAYDLCE